RSELSPHAVATVAPRRPNNVWGVPSGAYSVAVTSATQLWVSATEMPTFTSDRPGVTAIAKDTSRGAPGSPHAFPPTAPSGIEPTPTPSTSRLTAHKGPEAAASTAPGARAIASRQRHGQVALRTRLVVAGDAAIKPPRFRHAGDPRCKRQAHHTPPRPP